MRKNILGWRYTDNHPKTTEPENLELFLKEIDWFLAQMIERHALQYIKTYAGTASYTSSRFRIDQFIAIIFVSEDDMLSDKVQNTFADLRIFEKTLRERVRQIVSISIVDANTGFDESEVIGEGFYYKKVVPAHQTTG